MTLALLACMLVTFAALFYVFYLPGELHLGPEKTRLAYLRERKDAIYENLRDLMKNSMEEEAAAILSEISYLEEVARLASAKRRNAGREGARG